MMYSKVITVFLALMGSVTPGTAAVGPLAQEVRTETNEPQVVGTAISDGHTVYSVNQCTMFFTTACDISISYGPPVSTETSTSSVVLSSTENYPIPTSVVESSVPTASETTPLTTAASISTYPVYTGSETGSYATGTGTSTATAETGTPTAGGAFHGICQAAPIGAAVVAAVFLV
ncbi:unnamed protein product [Clonostachys chloroleuca]|uniref:Uncharacterized protein n=1 Tax=Clonostachys chloroleuca TaxID=1926264 RepID=A0AA35MAE6_9HYPO|nr:unnamed protein product [Clonostachys chloroleuca]